MFSRIKNDFKFYLSMNWTKYFFVCFFMLVMTVIMFAPNSIAYAGIFNVAEDITNLINDFFSGALRAFINGCQDAQFNMMETSGGAPMLSATWGNMFGPANGHGTQLNNFVQTVARQFVKPVGFGILSFIIIMQVTKVAVKADRSDVVVLGREMVKSLIFIAILYLIIDHSTDLMIGIYEFFNTIASKIATANATIPDATHIPNDVKDLGVLLVACLVSIIAMLASFLFNLLVTFCCYARGIQLYVYLAFAPLPLSLLGFDETKNYGINYLKAFAAVALSGAITLMVLYFYPMIAGTVATSFNTFGTGEILQGVNNTIDAIGSSLVLIIVISFALFKSGAWARDILGG